MLHYKVTKKYQRGPEQAIAKFHNLDDAKLFIEAKLEWDQRYKVEVNYILYDFDDVLEEYGSGSATSGGASSQGQGAQQTNSQVFSPSPLQMAPRPGSVPYSSFKDVKKSDDDEKK